MIVCVLTLISLLLNGCSKKITLNLAFGEKTGTYSGEMVNGVPDGKGKFTTTNSEGERWTYEGEFKNGHFEGEGKITWKSGQVEIGTYKDDKVVPLKGDEIKTLYTSTENFKGRCVEIIGKVFNSPEYVDGAVSLQMWADTENSDNNIIVYVADGDFKVKLDDYVKIVGIVGDVFKGKNAFGADVSAPTVKAKEYSVITYQEAVMPTISQMEINQTQTQFGYNVTLQKVEFAQKETRVFVKFENKGSAKFNLYSSNAKIIQNGKQYEEQSNWDADYPEIQTDLIVGTTTEGIIIFPAIEESSFKIILEASSDNYEERIKDFVFVTDEPKGDRNISGFNQKTNQTLSFYGVDFSFPSYFDALSDDSTKTRKIFYPKSTDCSANLEFSCIDFSGTQEDFNNKIPAMIDSLMGSSAFKNATFLKSQNATIAGMSGWTLTFLIPDKETVAPGSYSFFYNKHVGKIIGILCGYDSEDHSNYDYSGDYLKILETAVLSPKE